MQNGKSMFRAIFEMVENSVLIQAKSHLIFFKDLFLYTCSCMCLCEHMPLPEEGVSSLWNCRQCESSDMNTRNPNRVLWKSSSCAEAQRHLSSPNTSLKTAIQVSNLKSKY